MFGVTTVYVEKRAFYETISCTVLANRLIFNKRYWNAIKCPNLAEEGMLFNVVWRIYSIE